MSVNDIIERLDGVIADRKSADAEESYVARLNEKGLNKILEKVGEEAVETIIAAKDLATDASDETRRAQVVKETADLWFHTAVMLSHLGLSTADVLTELERRFGTSGLDEKAARSST